MVKTLIGAFDFKKFSNRKTVFANHYWSVSSKYIFTRNEKKKKMFSCLAFSNDSMD